MGIKTIIIDDFDGKTELPEGTEPVRFSFDGDLYDIYLSDESKAKLEKALEPFIDKATAVADEPVKPAGGKSSPTARNQRIRKWAIESKYEYTGVDGKMRTLGERGQIPQVVIDAAPPHVRNG